MRNTVQGALVAALVLALAALPTGVQGTHPVPTDAHGGSASCSFGTGVGFSPTDPQVPSASPHGRIHLRLTGQATGVGSPCAFEVQFTGAFVVTGANANGVVAPQPGAACAATQLPSGGPGTCESWDEIDWGLTPVDPAQPAGVGIDLEYRVLMNGVAFPGSGWVHVVPAPAFTPATAVTAGWFHTCVLLATGNVDCRGYDAQDHLLGNAVAVSGGAWHTCILTQDATTGQRNVVCQGDNGWSQHNNYLLGDAAAVSSGYQHTCVLRTNGNVDCAGPSWATDWAADYNGGDGVAIAAGVFATCVLKANGNVDCWGPNWDGEAVDHAGGNAVGVAAGRYHTCVLLTSGNVDCRGTNTNGQTVDYLGGDAAQVAAGWLHTCVLKTSGNVDCYGDNAQGQAADYLGGDAVAVTAGREHTCVLRADGSVTCHGGNAYGQSAPYP